MICDVWQGNGGVWQLNVSEKTEDFFKRIFTGNHFFKNKAVIIGGFLLFLYAVGYIIGQTIGNFI